MRVCGNGDLPVGVWATGKVKAAIGATRVEPTHRGASVIDASKKRMNGRVARRREEVKRYMRGCAEMYADSGSSPEIRMAKGDAGPAVRCDQTIPAAGSAIISGDGAARAHQGQRRPGG